MSIIQAILIALFYFFAQSTFFGVQYFTIYRPLVMGLIVGFILGDPVAGTTIGASINLLYIGHISAGGSLPGDPTLATIVGVSLAITQGTDVNASLAIASSVGLLGAFLWVGKLTINSIFVPIADKYAAEGAASKWWIANVALPQMLLFLMTFIPAFVMVYYGPTYIQQVLNVLGGSFLGILSTLGGMLPALGLALTLKFIFQGDARVYFFLGFLAIQLLGLNMIYVGLIGMIIAAIYLQDRNYVDNTVGDLKPTPEYDEEEADDFVPSVDIKTQRKVWFNFMFFAQSAYNYQNMQGLGFTHSMVPAFKKWYKEGSPEMVDALQRHTVFYNTNPTIGTIISGLVLAMEERNYVQGMQFDSDTINSIKTSLMGPVAGIADAILQGVLMPLLISFFVGMALDGNVAAPILYTLIMSILLFGMSWSLFKYGYRQGNEAIVNLLESGLINKFINAAKVMGAFVIGALVANYVNISTGIVWDFGEGNVFNLQTQFFDAILPNILPLLFTLGIYKLLQKGYSSTKVLLILVVISVIGSLTNILA